MPMPTSALWIMLQSFAPSPIARVMHFSSRLIKRTTAPFCLGVTRQQTTVLHALATWTNFFSICGSKAVSRHFPSITNPSNMPPFAVSSSARSAILASWRTRSCFWNSPFTSKSDDVSSGRSPFTSGSRRPVAMPMLMAVSVLSPVSIQTLMPACVILTIVSPTPSCNRSSMPVMPCSSRLASISSATASSFSCRLEVSHDASSNFFMKVSSSALDRSLPAKHSVRRPSSANSVKVSNVFSVSGDF
mmetsp:Transcript_26539/g.76398  ORF Transcript_26539/g.76398 Transcript_26539/m.76398 type:complete len:246 (+) Transcript_26539:1036-1773(+)